MLYWALEEYKGDAQADVRHYDLTYGTRTHLKWENVALLLDQ